MLILFWHYGYAPFGGNSMASHDASVQYLDFYSYFKDVLSVRNQQKVKEAVESFSITSTSKKA